MLEKGLYFYWEKKNQKDETKVDQYTSIKDAGVTWKKYLQVFRQAIVIDLYESLFSENAAGRPLAAGVIRLGTPLEEHKI